ncbi:MAG: bifunctional sulfate adenylyltransferase/adenylylsulfate kinase [Pseudomonadota bacterium]
MQQSVTEDLPSWNLTQRQLCAVELILQGAFFPLTGFMSEADYQQVLSQWRLTSGELCPMPVTLDVSHEFAAAITPGQQIMLRDPEFVAIAQMTVDSCWQPDKTIEVQQVYGTQDAAHPGVDHVLHRTGPVYLGGTLQQIELPTHYDYRQHRHSPDELRRYFQKLGWQRVVGFHTDRVMHRAEHNLVAGIARDLAANLLIHPTIGATLPGRLDHFTRVRCYERVLAEYSEQTTYLSLINLAISGAGAREALWHALIRQRYGCTHFIVSDVYADPLSGEYDQPAMQALAEYYATELEIELVVAEPVQYVPERAQYVPVSQIDAATRSLTLTDEECVRRLQADLPVPDWYSYPAVLAELRRACPPKYQQGFTVFFTGLSGSGKSTVANALRVKLLELGGRPVTLLDGDVVRKHLSSELTFSQEHRNLNIRRIGFVASEITKNGGIALCAPIAPYTAVRREVRDMIEAVGQFIEVHVATPLAECEKRDRKGLYAKARAGLLKQFTGIDDPYEAPENPEFRLDTTQTTPDECAHQLLLMLEKSGLIRV